MRDVTTQNFGLLIAYVLPGLTVLWGASPHAETLQSWLGAIPGEVPTVGGFLYATLASVAVGVIANTVRWLVVDRIHHATGILRPKLDFSRLHDRVAAYDFFNRHHYEHYQAHGNMLVGLVFVYIARRLQSGSPSTFGVIDLGYVLLGAVLFAGSRDTLRKFYTRAEAVLSDEKIGPKSPEGQQSHSKPADRTI